MRGPCRIGLLLGLGLLGPGLLGFGLPGRGGAAQAQAPDALAAPGDYSFAPPAYRQGGVAETSVGSHNMRSAGVRMDSGLIGDTGVRGFVALGAGQGPDVLRGADGAKVGVASHGAAVGLEKRFTDGLTLSLEGDWQRDRLYAR